MVMPKIKVCLAHHVGVIFVVQKEKGQVVTRKKDEISFSIFREIHENQTHILTLTYFSGVVMSFPFIFKEINTIKYDYNLEGCSRIILSDKLSMYAKELYVFQTNLEEEWKIK